MQLPQVRFRRVRRINTTLGIRVKGGSSMRCRAAIIDSVRVLGGAGVVWQERWATSGVNNLASAIDRDDA
jgi:hypothetical protein